MKIRTAISSIGVGGSLVLSNLAPAAYQGLTVTFHTVTPINGINRQVYRVFAVCSDPGDYITSVAGSPSLGNMTIRTRNALGTGGGGDFFNSPVGGNTAPNQSVIDSFPAVQWDTFATIGVAIDDGTDATSISPSFPTFIAGSTFTSNNAGWFTAGGVPQGLAGNGTQLGSMWGVLIMQLTVNAGNHVEGTVAIGGINNSPLAGGTAFQTGANQIFWSPAPSSLAAFAIALVSGRSRRRNGSL